MPALSDENFKFEVGNFGLKRKVQSPRERRRKETGGTKSLTSEEVSYIESARLGHPPHR
jgi:hypothetical protein